MGNNSYCKSCIHRKDWFVNEIKGIINTTYLSPFQDITDAETGDKQVFISRSHPCFGCKYIFDNDNYEEGLKKCPFCGSEANIYSCGNGDTPGKSYFISCSIPNCIETPVFSSRREAIDFWNRRSF